ncbi:MAG TPA: hypothetical protein VFK85_00525, partial [Anaeromyxobacteraceae bacterium]|nr:hypothetical protein [Anaeromyxobacteraceae bacterium]
MRSRLDRLLAALAAALLVTLPAALAACGSPRAAAHAERSGCDGCHGSGGLGLPPPSFSGATSTSDRGVGAHAAHLSSDLANPALSCSDCHVVPRTIGDPGHMSPASLVAFGARARAGGATPT